MEEKTDNAFSTFLSHFLSYAVRLFLIALITYWLLIFFYFAGHVFLAVDWILGDGEGWNAAVALTVAVIPSGAFMAFSLYRTIFGADAKYSSWSIALYAISLVLMTLFEYEMFSKYLGYE